MISMIDNRIPSLLNGKTIPLVLALSAMALPVSPFFPINRRVQERITALYLPAILIWWYLFQCQLMSLMPGGHYYLGTNGRFAWMMNSYICYAFGLAFSIGLVRLSHGWPRAVGVSFALIFFMLLLFGSVGGPFSPVVQET
jgi:hypothetical protein